MVEDVLCSVGEWCAVVVVSWCVAFRRVAEWARLRVVAKSAVGGPAVKPSLRIAEVVQGLLFFNEGNKASEEPSRPVDFYLSTYGGNADDMFALYDIMRMIEPETPLHTIGVGKVMSAGVLLLAAGTKGERRIMKNCRIMIHSVAAGNHGDLHSLVNEIEALQDLQEMYINCLVQETKMTKSQLKKMLERKVNVYLSAERAVELGIADIIV